MQFARAFGSLLGMNIMGSYDYGDSFESGKTIGQASVSIALDLNLYPKTNIPLGLSTAYAYTSIPDFTAAQDNTTWIGSTG